MLSLLNDVDILIEISLEQCDGFVRTSTMILNVLFFKYFPFELQFLLYLCNGWSTTVLMLPQDERL
jgi:hypothetical protein